MAREAWLKGWKRCGPYADNLNGATCCVGCGGHVGCYCFIPYEDGPTETPDWPFDEETCPVCGPTYRPKEKAEMTLQERLEIFKEMKRAGCLTPSASASK
jgi:hypothetical protein